MKLTRIERWISNENNHEIHFFSSKNRSDYVLGFNPDLIPEEDVLLFLRLHGIHPPLPTIQNPKSLTLPQLQKQYEILKPKSKTKPRK